MFIVDKDNHRIRKITVSTGDIITIAGSGGTGTTSGGFSGDDDVATSALLKQPQGIALDSTGILSCVHLCFKIPSCNFSVSFTVGNFYIADTGNERIRKVTVTTGIITTIAGTGASGYGGDNDAATSATLSNPFTLAMDSSGNVYIADTYNNCIRKVTISTGVITTIAGTGTSSYSGDNSAATAATFNTPRGIDVDLFGNVYIADQDNARIRKVTVSTSAPRYVLLIYYTSIFKFILSLIIVIPPVVHLVYRLHKLLVQYHHQSLALVQVKCHRRHHH